MAAFGASSWSFPGGRVAFPLALIACSCFLPAQNWPQWRGPSASGISEETNLPVRWDARQNVQWKSELAGLGVSSPIVWQGRVYVTSQIGNVPVREGSHPRLARDDQSLMVQEKPLGGLRPEERPEGKVWLVVEAFDLESGRRLWEYRTEATGEFPELHEKHNLASPTPLTDGQHIYAWFGNGQVLALDMNGAPVWKRHLGKEYSPFLNQWGHGSSPVRYQGLLLLLCDHRSNAYLLALDKETGAEQWKVERGAGHVSHSTPLVVPAEGRDELIVNSSERIDAYNPLNGKLLWWLGEPRQTPIPTPVFSEGVIYMSRGYRNSDFLAIRTGGSGDVTATHVLWRSPSGASYVPSILFYDRLLYMTNEVGVVTCAEASTGQRVWRERLGGIFYASPVAAAGKVYFVSETGETFVLRAGREPELLAVNDLGERLLASPAISRGSLLLRSDRHLFCIR